MVFKGLGVQKPMHGGTPRTYLFGLAFFLSAREERGHVFLDPDPAKALIAHTPRLCELRQQVLKVRPDSKGNIVLGAALLTNHAQAKSRWPHLKIKQKTQVEFE